MNHLFSSFGRIIFSAIYRLQLPTGKPANMGTAEKKQSFLSACRLQLNFLTALEMEVGIPLKHILLAKQEVVVTPQQSPPQNTAAREEFLSRDSLATIYFLTFLGVRLHLPIYKESHGRAVTEEFSSISVVNGKTQPQRQLLLLTVSRLFAVFSKKVVGSCSALSECLYATSS